MSIDGDASLDAIDSVAIHDCQEGELDDDCDQENESAVEQNDSDSYMDFMSTFFRSKPAMHLLVVAFFMAMGVGSTVGVVPSIMADRYARSYYGYTDNNGQKDCFSYTTNKPDACQKGANKAQEAAAMMTFVTNMFTLLCNSAIGTMSDTYGRRGVLVLSMFLSTISPAVLLLMQIIPTMDPFWFYASNSIVGVVNYVSICFTVLSDVIPKRYRTPGFGLFMGTFYLGFSLSPSMTFIFTHWQVSIFSFIMMILGFIYTVCFLPETLPSHVAIHNQQQSIRSSESIGIMIIRPLQGLKILNQNMAIRLVAVGAFISGMVYSTDATLCLYYFENHLHVNDSDLARMFLVMGFVGIVIQAFLLKFLLQILGEKGLLVTSFISGTIHNLIYGLAQTKFLIYVALSLSQLTKTNFPILSSLASAHATDYQQGSIQGALFALSALANAIGPMCLQLFSSNGQMFVVASGLYLIGTLVVSFLPDKKRQDEDNGDLEEPLLTLEERPIDVSTDS